MGLSIITEVNVQRVRLTPATCDLHTCMQGAMNRSGCSGVD